MRQKITFFLIACLCTLVAMTAAKKIGPDKLKGIAPTSQVATVKANKAVKKFKKSKRAKFQARKGIKALPKEEETWESLLSENFNTLTEGSEAAPGSSIFDEDGLVIEGLLPSSDDWEGWACYQAGGELYVGTYEAEDEETGEPFDDPGFLTSPYLDLTGLGMGGKVKISVKAKSAAASDKYYIVLVDDLTEEYQYVEESITSSWKTIEGVFDVAAGEDYLVQIYALSSPCFVDDFEISFAASKTAPAAPLATEATEITSTGFLANWKDAAGAESYLVNVFTQEAHESEEVNVNEGFDGIVLVSNKNIDAENSVFPEGWTIDVTTNGTSRHGYGTAGNFGEAAPSLCFDATGDFIQTPVAAAPITKISFWAKGQSADATSSVKVEGYNGSEWSELGVITADKFSTAGVYNFEFTATDVLAFRLSYTKGTGNVAIDDVAYTSGGTTYTRTPLVTDQAATASPATISGISMVEGTDYFYTVRAVNQFGTSPESNIVRVGDRYIDPEKLDTPVALPATEISNAGFTANWEEVLSAQYYSVGVGLNHKAPADETYVICNEDFSSQTQGTIDAPAEGSWIDDFDQFTTRPDWMGISTCYAEGCVGFDNAEEMLFAPCIMSPTYNLAANGGKVKVKFDIYATETTTATIELYNVTEDEDEDDEEVLEALSIKAEDDDEGDDDEDEDLPLCTKSFEAGPSWQTVELELDNATESCNFQISALGETTKVFIDNITVSKDLKAGDAVDLPYAYYEQLAPFTSIEIATPDWAEGDSYNYFVVALKDDPSGEDYVVSPSSEIIYVEPSGVQKIIADSAARAFVSNGILRISNPNGKAINVYSVNGALVYSSRGETSATVTLAARGVYIVKVGDKAIKVIR